MRFACGCLLVLAADLIAAGQTDAQAPLRIAIFPFEDRAGFQGEWNLATDVPVLLGRYLSDIAQVHIIPVDTVQAVAKEKKLEEHEYMRDVARLGRHLGADIVIVGVVENFGTRRLTAGDPNLIGYKSYTSRIELKTVRLINVASAKELDVLDISDETQDRPVGLDLFGRPRQQDREFRELFKVEFASERFFDLQLGKLTADVFKELSKQIIRTLVERPPIDLSGELAKVLSIEEEAVFIGLGSQNHVEHGDVLPIYDGEGVQMALVEVDDVLGSQLSRARILEQSGPVEVGYKLGQRMPKIEIQSSEKE